MPLGRVETRSSYFTTVVHWSTKKTRMPGAVFSM